jgi:hypothetical protein
MALTNQEKSEDRNRTMNQIAEQVAEQNAAFRYHLIIKGDPDSNSYPPTWRRLETFLKQQFEEGKVIRIVVAKSQNSPLLDKFLNNYTSAEKALS